MQIPEKLGFSGICICDFVCVGCPFFVVTDDKNRQEKGTVPGDS